MKRSTKIILSIVFCLVISSLVIFVTVFHKNTASIDLSAISNGDSQPIAILDSGLDNSLLEEYQDSIIAKYNVFDDSENIADEIGHGTSITSFILGSEKYHFSGILPSAKIIIIKVIDNEGHTTFEYLEEGILYAKKMNASIINMSLGGDMESPVLNEIIKEMSEEITFVSSSGDYGDKDLLYPSNQESVISVGSINQNYEISKFSNFNPNIVCNFPGEDIKVLSKTNNTLEVTKELYGTSYSSIYASAYISAIKDYAYKNKIPLSNYEIKKILKDLDPYKMKKIITDVDKIFQNKK